MLQENLFPRALLLTALVATGCSHYPWPRTPMGAIQRSAGGARQTLIVLLPGVKDRSRVFEDEGFIDAFRRHHTDADVIAADAHAGYYAWGTFERRLRRDVILPARKRYRNIILVGVSLGGYGAVRYAMTHPNEICELVLLSPFLGAGPFLRKLAEAGDEDFRSTWDWLKGHDHPRIILGYGHEDVFLKTDAELGALLPASDVVTTTGVHVWSTWRALLEQILANDLLAAKP
jgi:pimeloyl-ACP methyl ester carboxylesterase